MDHRCIFETGARLIGLYFLVWALPYVVGGVIQAIILLGTTEQIFVREKLYDNLSFASDLLLAVAGLCLLKGYRLLRRIVFSEHSELLTSRMSDYFTVGTKLLGVILVVGSMPGLMRQLAYFLYVATSPSESADTALHVMGSQAYFVPRLISILFGLLLFFRGELLSNWAFAERNGAISTDQNS